MRYFLILLVSLPLLAADIYDTNTGTYIERADTNQYVGKSGFIINPDISAIATIDEVADQPGVRPRRVVTWTVPRKYWKWDGSALVEMDQAEKDAVDTDLNDKAAKRADKAATVAAAKPKRSEVNAALAKLDTAVAAEGTLDDVKAALADLGPLLHRVLIHIRVPVTEDVEQ
jgi:hypothetical protein